MPPRTRLQHSPRLRHPEHQPVTVTYLKVIRCGECQHPVTYRLPVTASEALTEHYQQEHG